MVSFKDEKGQIHYVNTDYSKVPEKYRAQIEEGKKERQTSKEEGMADQNPLDLSELKQSSAVEYQVFEKKKGLKNLPIKVFTSTTCADCHKLITLLRANHIPFETYHVGHDQKAKQLFEQVGTGILPLTQIGLDWIPGYEPKKILNLMKSYEEQTMNPSAINPDDDIPNLEQIKNFP